MEDAVNAYTAEGGGQIVVAGAGYAGLHVALRLTARLRNHPETTLTLVDRHDYHQALTELPRVAGGTRAADAVRIPLQDMLAERVRIVQTEINGFDLPGRQLLTGAGPVGWGRLVLALGSRPNDFAIPGLAERTLSLYSAGDAERVWAAAGEALAAAAAVTDPGRQRRLATVVVGGGGATGVELAGELAETLPKRRAATAGARSAICAAGRGGPHHLGRLLTAADRQGRQNPFRPRGPGPHRRGDRRRYRGRLPAQGRPASGGRRVRLGGRAEGTRAGGRFGAAGRSQRPGKGDRFLRVLDRPDIYVAGDLASVTDPRTGHVLPSLAQVALEEGETVARNLDAELEGRRLRSSASATWVRRLGRRPPRGRRHRRHHQRRANGPPAQRCHRVGVPPVCQAPARLGPGSPVTAAAPRR